MTPLRPPLALLAAPLVWALAQDAHALQYDRPIREDLEFARGLAADWQFVELAESVLEGIDVGQASDRVKEEVALTRCDVYASGARRERDDLKRQDLFDRALVLYRDYLDENRFAENRGQAERELVNLASTYGQDLFRLYQEAIGDEAARLRGKVSEVLEDAIDRTADLGESLASSIEDEERAGGSTVDLERERFVLMLNRGQMYLTLGEVAENGTYFFEKADELLQDTAAEAGDSTSFGLNAYLILGDVYAAQGLYLDSTDFVSYVVDQAIPSDRDTRLDGFDPVSQGEKEARWHFVDKATGPLVDAFLGAGDIESACVYGLHFQNCIDTYGFQVTRPKGYQSMLAVARALIDSGGHVGGSPGEFVWYATREEMEGAHSSRRDRRSALDLALKLAQQVNRDNRGNTLQLEAQKVISEVIDRGVAVDPEVLFEAAQGSYFEGDYTSAIEAFKRVLAVLDTSEAATRTRLGPEVLWHIGRSFQKSNRLLEAAMAFRTGLDDRWKGDPKFDSENATRFHESMKIIQSKAKGDPLVDSMFRESEDLVIANPQAGGNAGDIRYSQAENAYNKREYEDARVKFLEVPGNAAEYEKAIVYAAVCLKRLGDVEQAVSDLEEYLGPFVADPVRQPTTETGKTVRQEAMGLATYYLGHAQFEAAEAGTGSHDDVIATLGNYVSDYADQQSFGARSSLMVLSSHLAKGEVDEAVQRLELMKAKFPTDTSTALGAHGIYSTYAERRKTKLEKDPDADVSTLTRGMAENLSLYNTLSSKPRLNNMRIEGDLWLELEDWESAETVLSRGLASFPDDPNIDKHVVPDLAHAKLMLRKVRDAAELLDPLMQDEEYQGGRQAARDYGLALTGWVEGSGSDLVEIPGIGDAESIPRAAKILLDLENAERDKWTCAWYQLKFEVAYAYYRWGQFDGKKLDSARTQIEQLEADLSPGMKEIAEACGDPVLQNQFQWLKSKL